jgi:PAS domain S-box-containing protein
MEPQQPALFENTEDPIIRVRFEDETPVIAAVNPAFEDVFGFAAETVTGRDITDILVPDSEHDEHLSLREEVLDGESVEAAVTRETRDSVRQFELRVIPYGDGAETTGAYAWYVDRTEEKAYEARLESLNEASQELITATTEREVADITVRIVRRVLDQPLTAMWSYDAEADILRPLTATDEATRFDASAAGAEELGEILPGTREMEVFRDGDVTVIEDYSAIENPAHPDTDLGTVLMAPIGEFGQLHVGSRTRESFDPGTTDLVEILAQNAQAALDRVHRERVLSDLNDVARLLLETTTSDEIISIATEAGSNILELPYTHVYLKTDDGERLEPVGMTDEMTERFGELPSFDRAEGLLWDVLESGETHVYDDVQSEADTASEMPFRGAVLAPLGRKGVFASGSRRAAEFDTFDRKVVSILAASTEAALDRAEREKRLREHETELTAARDRFRSVFEHSNDAIVIFDPETDEILEANPRATELLGYSYDELLSLGPSDIHPDEMPEFRSFLETVRADSSGRTDRLSCMTKAGEHVPAEISASTLDFDGRESVLALIRDVSELRAYERELERQNERLEEFAGVISHDLRNPLAVAKGRLELASEDDESEHLKEVASALDRMEEMIEDILMLTRVGDSDLSTEAVDLGEIVSGCWTNVDTEDATLEISTDLTVLGDESRLRHVFENLFRNAVEHGGADVTIRVGDLSDGGGFYVEDTGPGIPADVREEIFDHGYTGSDGGTGFGLSIVEEIVQAHGWEARATEGADGGARFEITDVDVAGSRR